jgi:hypothetical protein
MRLNPNCGIGASLATLLVCLAYNSAACGQTTTFTAATHGGEKAALIGQLRQAHKLLAHV